VVKSAVPTLDTDARMLFRKQCTGVINAVPPVGFMENVVYRMTAVDGVEYVFFNGKWWSNPGGGAIVEITDQVNFTFMDEFIRQMLIVPEVRALLRKVYEASDRALDNLNTVVIAPGQSLLCKFTRNARIYAISKVFPNIGIFDTVAVVEDRDGGRTQYCDYQFREALNHSGDIDGIVVNNEQIMLHHMSGPATNCCLSIIAAAFNATRLNMWCGAARPTVMVFFEELINGESWVLRAACVTPAMDPKLLGDAVAMVLANLTVEANGENCSLSLVSPKNCMTSNTNARAGNKDGQPLLIALAAASRPAAVKPKPAASRGASADAAPAAKAKPPAKAKPAPPAPPACPREDFTNHTIVVAGEKPLPKAFKDTIALMPKGMVQVVKVAAPGVFGLMPPAALNFSALDFPLPRGPQISIIYTGSELVMPLQPVSGFSGVAIWFALRKGEKLPIGAFPPEPPFRLELCAQLDEEKEGIPVISGGNTALFGCIGKEMLPNPALSAAQVDAARLRERGLAALAEHLERQHPALTAWAIWVLETGPQRATRAGPANYTAAELAAMLLDRRRELEVHEIWHGSICPTMQPEALNAFANKIEAAATEMGKPTDIDDREALLALEGEPAKYIAAAVQRQQDRRRQKETTVRINDALSSMTPVFCHNTLHRTDVEIKARRSYAAQLQEQKTQTIGDVGEALRGGDEEKRNETIAAAMDALDEGMMVMVVLPEVNFSARLRRALEAGSLSLTMPDPISVVFDASTVGALAEVARVESFATISIKSPLLARVPNRGAGPHTGLAVPLPQLCGKQGLFALEAMKLSADPSLMTLRQLVNEVIKEVVGFPDPADANRLMVLAYLKLAEWFASLTSANGVPEGELLDRIRNAVACAAVTAAAGQRPCSPGSASFFSRVFRPDGTALTAAFAQTCMALGPKLGLSPNDQQELRARALQLLVHDIRALEWTKAHRSTVERETRTLAELTADLEKATPTIQVKVEMTEGWNLCLHCDTLRQSSSFPCSHSKSRHGSRSREAERTALGLLVQEDLPADALRAELIKLETELMKGKVTAVEQARRVLPVALAPWAQKQAEQDVLAARMAGEIPRLIEVAGAGPERLTDALSALAGVAAGDSLNIPANMAGFVEARIKSEDKRAYGALLALAAGGTNVQKVKCLSAVLAAIIVRQSPLRRGEAPSRETVLAEWKEHALRKAPVKETLIEKPWSAVSRAARTVAEDAASKEVTTKTPLELYLATKAVMIVNYAMASAIPRRKALPVCNNCDRIERAQTYLAKGNSVGTVLEKVKKETELRGGAYDGSGSVRLKNVRDESASTPEIEALRAEIAATKERISGLGFAPCHVDKVCRELAALPHGSILMWLVEVSARRLEIPQDELLAGVVRAAMGNEAADFAALALMARK